jgi:hypothetical protein
MICTAYWIVLVGEIKVDMMGEPYGTYRRDRNKDRIYNFSLKKGITGEF